MTDKKQLELYIHIPFCVRKCAYCDFLSFPPREGEIGHYLTALYRQFRQYAGRMADYEVRSVFIGGGTPSILNEKQIAELMDQVRGSFYLKDNAEITMECNPGTLTHEKLLSMKHAGISRLSLGLQSCNNRELHLLGRIHTFQDFLDSYRMAREAGFENINVDLMSGLPGQTPESWENTLKTAASLNPEHISAYGLIIEEGTPFYRLYEKDELAREEGEETEFLPDEESDRAMYHATRRILEQYGYHRYEISNYAKEKKECLHNKGYWTGVEYLGLGLGASSMLCDTGAGYARRFHVTRSLSEYLDGDYEEREEETVTVSAAMEEFMFLGLRMMCGVSVTEFYRRFGCRFEDVYGKVYDRMESLGLMEKSTDRVRLTEEGIDVSNYVMSEFLLS